jgi:TPP-dependent pyruvate/acetoin dehydrogenase alpha subunit
MFGTMHPYIGQEAIAVGVSSALHPNDRVVSNHRGHGHLIAKGADVDRMMAELLGRVDGYCRGKGGSMHIADFALGILGANGIVGAGLPMAVGSGIAAQVLGEDVVTIAFFGDGASGEGTFHESLNIAAMDSLPVVFVCENNQYAAETPVERSLPAGSVAGYAPGYGIPSAIVDGTDVVAVASAAEEAVARARGRGGPTLLECRAFRFGVHAQRRAPVPEKRPTEQIAFWRDRDPLVVAATRIVEAGLATGDELAAIRREADARIDRAVAFAEASPFPAPAEALDGAWT